VEFEPVIPAIERLQAYALDCKATKHGLFPKYLFNLSKPTGFVMQNKFNIQQLYALPTLYLCVSYIS